jgi:hypothetical protein
VALVVWLIVFTAMARQPFRAGALPRGWRRRRPGAR